jgi:hypothetical protein
LLAALVRVAFVMRGVSRRALGAFIAVLVAGCSSAGTAAGAGWSPLTIPDTGIHGLACTSAAHCLAFGANSTLSWNGDEWTREGSAAARGVTCRSAGWCIAVGSIGVPDSVPLIERLRGGRWSTQPSPDPIRGLPSVDHESSELDSVDCPATKWCVAVGRAAYSTPHMGVFVAAVPQPNPRALIERWNGRRWMIVRLAPLGGELTSVSCRSSTQCIAVGGGLALRWNGRHWLVQRAHRPPGVWLRSVSCPTARTCVAVGDSAGLPAAERWNGRRWSLVATTLPAGHSNGTLQAVDCVSEHFCQAVGQYYSNSGPPDIGPLVAAVSGTRWNLTALPPAGPPIESLSTVSCVSTQWCMAAGNGFAEMYS